MAAWRCSRFALRLSVREDETIEAGICPPQVNWTAIRYGGVLGKVILYSFLLASRFRFVFLSMKRSEK
jgi:hypothetical protein